MGTQLCVLYSTLSSAACGTPVTDSLGSTLPLSNQRKDFITSTAYIYRCDRDLRHPRAEAEGCSS